MKPITHANLADYKPREYILLAGHPGTGKSTAMLSVAELNKRLHPDSIMYVIDTENGFLKIWQYSYPKVDNVQLYICRDMDEVIQTFDEIVPKLKSTDWLAIESMSRIWEYAQNLGYTEITGLTKAEYLTQRLAKTGTKDPVTPDPSNLWQIAKDAQNRCFLDVIQLLDPELNKNGCNIIMSASLGAAPGDRPNQSAERKAVREALGVTMNIEGVPRLPYYPDTVLLLTNQFDGYWVRVLKDRGPEDKKYKLDAYNDFYLKFLSHSRRG